MPEPTDTPQSDAPDLAASRPAGPNAESGAAPRPKRASAGKRVRRTLKLAKMKGAAEPAAGGAQCKYLAIIMDGNGRWAQKKRLPVAAGHTAGAKALRRILEHALDLGIKEVTAYAFSTENWARPEDEVHALMDLFIEQIESQVPDMHERGARIRFVGSRDGVPPELVRRIDEAESLTAANQRMTLFIAFNYGARQEILDAAAGLAAEWAERGAAAAGGPRAVAPSTPAAPSFTADDLRRHLYAPEMHDPELLVRTSGEQRISNFLLWQVAYSELCFSDKLWPDFAEEDLDEALAEYARRQRRFGGRS
jgi:undecaprenyl diphosphate synthase